MLGKDKIFFALFKACIYFVMCFHVMERKTKLEHGEKLGDSWGDVFVKDFILLNPYNFTCKVAESIVCTSKFCLNRDVVLLKCKMLENK